MFVLSIYLVSSNNMEVNEPLTRKSGKKRKQSHQFLLDHLEFRFLFICMFFAFFILQSNRISINKTAQSRRGLFSLRYLVHCWYCFTYHNVFFLFTFCHVIVTRIKIFCLPLKLFPKYG